MTPDEIQKQFLTAVTDYADEDLSIVLDVLSAIFLVSSLQLVCRHPEFRGVPREFAEKFARDIQERLGLFAPELSAGLELGWHPENDVTTADMKCRVCGCTNERACPGGCHWAEPGLCSQCAPAARSIIVP